MTTKITSADAYEDMRSLGDRVFRQYIFDRTDVQGALDALAGLRGFEVPSAKSFLDWARRESIVVPVEGERGHYRWAPSVEAEAAEIGRQMATGTDLDDVEMPGIYVTDMDPKHPMILDAEEDDLDLAEDHFNYRESVEQESCQDHDEDATSAAVADVRAYIVTHQTRLPRKEKKRMKKVFRDATGVKKVQFVHAANLETAWEMANR